MDTLFGLSQELLALEKEVMTALKEPFARVEEITEYNQQKVLGAFINHRVCEQDFAATTGYGYDDAGRDKLDRLFAQIVGAEDSLVRFQIANGTQALSLALFGVLRPGDCLLCATGAPYDTLEEVVGFRGEKGTGSLMDFGVTYKQIELTEQGQADIPAILNQLTDDVKMVYIQRSKGYSSRPALSVAKIGDICRAVHEKKPDTVILADNCYGEFVEKQEPVEVGANLMAGSLIKNPGGGLARCGGYIAGDKDLVELCSYRLTTQGIGREVGASLGFNRELFMGLFQAPHVVGEALKSALFAACLLDRLGYAVSPYYTDIRRDIIQSVDFGDPQKLIAFCQGIQSGSPVDSYVTPEPWDMPGYAHQVIMAAGTFTSGASIELSCDAPIREPYTAYLQGGLNFHSAKAAILKAVMRL